jgi:hypothetical protein
MRRVASATVLLVLAVVVGALTVSVAYGFALEYGDTGTGRWRSALDGLRWWWFGVAIVAVLAAGAVLLSRGSLPLRSAAAVLVAGTLAGTGVGAAIGTEQKLDRYPATPGCTAELTSGPAVPVVRAAESAFEELDHPGPFTGGGSSGIDGCSSELVVRDGTDPRPAYRRSLAEHGWTVERDDDRLRAVRDGQALELTRSDGAWTVWIGPAHLEERPLGDGEVGPRR